MKGDKITSSGTKLEYFDIHGHINFRDYDHDREEVIERARKAGVGMITVGTDSTSSEKAVELAAKYDFIWASVGIHPTEAVPKDEHISKTIDEDINSITKLARNQETVAIGECGLDYFHLDKEHSSVQREILERHIDIANSLNKPLMLHIRNGRTGGNAYQEAIIILKKKAKVRPNFHFFAGTVEDLKDILDINGTVSFTGVITFTRDYDELIRYAPLTNIMSETDCPFVAPTPYRGKRNEPSFVVETVKAIAKIRNENESEVKERLILNVCDFFGIDKFYCDFI